MPRVARSIWTSRETAKNLKDSDKLLQRTQQYLTKGWGWGVWSGVAKVSCILCHQGVHMILAYSWARFAILVASKGKGECFYSFCFSPFISVPLSSLSLSFISSNISSISFLPFSGRWHKMSNKGWRFVKPQHNQQSDKGTCAISWNHE